MNAQEIDIEGHVTLNVIEKANLFNKWMYNTISPFCNGRILEIGSGIGNISNFFIHEGKDIVLTDLRDNYCEILKKKYGNTVLRIDIVNPNFDLEYISLFESFDTVYALNVIEHIENDKLAVANCKKLLKKNGRLVILVPAYQYLFCRFDNELGHYRRYTHHSLAKIIKANGLSINKTFYFNAFGLVGWFIFGKMLGHQAINSGEMNLYNRLTPVLKLADLLTLKRIGLSVICISEKV